MKFEEIKERRNLNISKLAEVIGYSRSHVQGVITGRYRAGKKFMKAIEQIPFEEVSKWKELESGKEENI